MPVRIPVTGATRAPSGRTNAYILDGDDPLLVDPAARSDDLDRAVCEYGVSHVAVTHHHPDHVGAVASYAEEHDLTVWARIGRADAFQSATAISPDRLFSPGERLPVAGGVTVLDMPGHAPEHVAFVCGDELLVGDLVVDSGSVVVGAPEGDMRAYLSSLRRIHARNPGRLLPGHGPRIDDSRAACFRLIDHRLRREQHVLSAVQAGNETAEDITEAAYEKDISAVFDLAQATVIAHLEKLDVEAKLVWNGTRAYPV